MKSARSRRLWKGIAATAVVAALVATGVSVWWLTRYGLAVHRLTRGVGDTVFYGADGRPWFRLDEQRHDVGLAEIAPDFQHAVVAIEDRRFYLHPGIDPIGVVRAVYHDVREGAAVEGASTLTQQLETTRQGYLNQISGLRAKHNAQLKAERRSSNPLRAALLAEPSLVLKSSDRNSWH